MHLLKLVWSVSLCIVHGESEGKTRLHPHRASVGEQDFGDMAMSISAAGQPVMRREAKQDSTEESLARHDEMPTEHQRLALEHALRRVAELSEDLNPTDAGYRESLLKKVKEIMDHDDVHNEQKQRSAAAQAKTAVHKRDHKVANSKAIPKALIATSDVMPIKVEGCQDAATAKVIEGYYVPTGTTGGKPSYKKDGSGTGEDEVWLYHYDDVDAGSVGWWIGSNPSGRVHIYAFNPSKAELPPSSGWKAPWWGDVDGNLLVANLSQEEVPQDLMPTEVPEVEEMVTEAPEVDETFTATAAPEETVEMATTAPEEEKAESLDHKAPSIGKDLEPSELQHVLKEEGDMITAAVAKLSSGKKLADMIFGTDTAVIPAEPPSAEMLEKLAEDPELAKKALNRTVSILQRAVSHLKSGEAFADELLGTNTSKWLQTTEEVVNASMVPISKHVPREDNETDAAEEEGGSTTTTADEPPIEGSAAAPLMKKVDEVAAAAKDAAEKARLWKDAEIAGLHAKQAAEEAKKKVEKLTVQAAKEEAEKAIEKAVGSETAEAKEEAGKLAAKADAEVAEKETEVAKAKKKLESMQSATAEEREAAEKELTVTQEAVKVATVKADVLEKKADDIKLAKHKESDDNALYSQGDDAEETQGRIIMGSRPKSDGEKILEEKLDILQSKLQGLERVQMKDKLEDTLSASLAEVSGDHGIRLLASEPKDVNGPTDEDDKGGDEGEKKPKKKGRKGPKGSWNRITVFVMAALMVCVLACGAVYQLVVIRRMKQHAKVEEKQPLMKEEDTAAGNPGGATEEVQENPAPAGS